MPSRLRFAYFAHTLRSDWNNGNAHFLRGLLLALRNMGHTVVAFEPEGEWSVSNLLQEEAGRRSLDQFGQVYAGLDVRSYPAAHAKFPNSLGELLSAADHFDAVILHEWNPPELAQSLLALRPELGYKLLFHDTHHRASSSPEAFAGFRLAEFDGVLAFGEALRRIYRERFGLEHVWTLHEAADTTVFHPLPLVGRRHELVWIGNWGEGERSAEIRNFLIGPTAALLHSGELSKATIYGVRYPPEGNAALREAGMLYGGYLPNLDAPAIYAAAALTVHIPRQQYSEVMAGIPTIRVFEALACGIPLVSGPWEDTEQLFRPGDFALARTPDEMLAAMRRLLAEPAAAAAQAAQGRQTILDRHTCAHRAAELTAILDIVLGRSPSGPAATLTETPA